MRVMTDKVDQFSRFDQFFDSIKKPNNLEDVHQKVEHFVESNFGQPIVLISSGGTSVPLEHNTVRYLDNFSHGTRGAASAEYFLDYNYKVIYLFREGSKEPFKRHLNCLNVFKLFNCNNGKLEVCEDSNQRLKSIVEKYSDKENDLLSVPFVTLSDYFYFLREICFILKPLGPNAILYLAAAVSDFYLPLEEMSIHKIPSDQDNLELNLKPVPKLLLYLTKSWVPEAYVITFKLETNQDIFLPKARKSLNDNRSNLVIANMLNNRKKKVFLISHDSEVEISISDDKYEIETIIVDKVIQSYKNFLLTQSKA